MRWGYTEAMRASGTRRGAQGDLPERRNPAHTLCHVLAGQRRARNVLDISPEVQALKPLAPIELVAPGSPPDLTAMALAIRQDLERAHPARGIDSNRVGNHVLSPKDLVHEHITEHVSAPDRLPGTQGTMRR